MYVTLLFCASYVLSLFFFLLICFLLPQFVCSCFYSTSFYYYFFDISCVLRKDRNVWIWREWRRERSLGMGTNNLNLFCIKNLFYLFALNLNYRKRAFMIIVWVAMVRHCVFNRKLHQPVVFWNIPRDFSPLMIFQRVCFIELVLSVTGWTEVRAVDF